MALPERMHQEIDWTDLCGYARRAARRTGLTDWEDIAQEALLRVWARWSAGDDMAVCRRQLARAVRNVVVDRHRAAMAFKRGSGRAPVSLDAQTVAGPDSDAKRRAEAHELCGGGADLADAVTLRLILWPAYRRLPAAHRQALALRAQGCQGPEIARALRVPLGTVKSRLTYATARMRRMLAEG